MFRKTVKKILPFLGIKFNNAENSEPKDLEKGFIDFYKKCQPYTMTSVERMYAAYKATEYIVKNNIEGSVVECGVWKGGSAMIMALQLLKMNITDKDFYLYDTYEGMAEPGEKDKDLSGASAKSTWELKNKGDHNEWCYSSLDEVKSNLYSTGYPKEKFHFVKGKVEDTIPGSIPQKISLLRLDTDWYESTYHELKHLYPLLKEKGVLIVDDYGHWEGAREATDKYFKENNINMLLNRIDYTGRMGVK